MQLKFTSLTGSPHLVLIFTGWATDWRLFERLSIPGADVAVIWDYSSDTVDVSPLSRYLSIEVYAWSFGVFVASWLLAGDTLPVVRRVAVNGTMTPVSDTLGIPVAVFNATLDTLDERSLTKFYRRICGSASVYAHIKELLPPSDIERLRAALRNVRDLSEKAGPAMRWDEAIISDSDAIFPPENMRRAWRGTPIREISGPHLPDFGRLFMSIDKRLVAKRFSGSRETYDSNAVVQRRIAARLFDLWRDAGLPRRGSRIIEIGVGTGLFTRLYLPSLEACDVELWDLAPCDVPGCRVVICDAESSITASDDKVDCIVTSSTLQWFADAPAFIANAAQRLRSGGLLVVSTFGPDNMSEIVSVTGPSLRYHSLDNLVAAACDFDVVSACEERDVLDFPDAMSVMRHLKLTGTTGTVAGPSSATMARKLLRRYPSRDGVCHLTYHPIYLILKRK
ncbi:MAG: DUF452 family protein [Pseudoflavonifractor sp.]|nr:DUF452 family protein [Pseudoflavonifractor sp.]